MGKQGTDDGKGGGDGQEGAGDQPGAPRRVQWGKKKDAAAVGTGEGKAGGTGGGKGGKGDTGGAAGVGAGNGKGKGRGGGDPDVPAPLECTQKAGQLIYVPESWYVYSMHACLKKCAVDKRRARVIFLTSFGPPHVRAMGHTCGELNEIDLAATER